VNPFDGASLHVTVVADGNSCALAGVSGQSITSYIDTANEDISNIFTAQRFLCSIKAALDKVASARGGGFQPAKPELLSDGLVQLKTTCPPRAAASAGSCRSANAGGRGFGTERYTVWFFSEGQSAAVFTFLLKSPPGRR